MSRMSLEILADVVEGKIVNLEAGSVMAVLHPALLEALEAAFEMGRAEAARAIKAGN